MADFLIVGGGLIGLLTARNLSKMGARVTLVERGQLGQESSWAGGGILSPLYPWKYPQPINVLSGWSQAYYPTLAQELLADTGIDPEYVRSGLLILDADERAPALAWSPPAAQSIVPVEAAEVRRIEPALGQEHPGAVWMPEVAQVRNPLLVAALKRDLALRGVHVAENTEVTHLLTRRERIQGVRTEYSEIRADQVIIACGAWSATLLKELGYELPVMPVRGQMILFKARPRQLQRIVLSEGHYLIPRRDGHVLVGSTMEEVGFDKTVTEQARDDLATIARRLVPSLADAPLERHWAGLRPGSPTGVPFIGAHPKVEGLYINAGHFRNGVVMAPASAQLLVDILTDHPTAVDPAPYALAGRSHAA
jgi:glycine oxidase